MRKKIGIVFFCVLTISIILLNSQRIERRGSVFINEVRSTVASANRDGYFGSDYIEVFNSSDSDICLDGWYLSDEENNLLKNRISNITIPAKDYVVFYPNEELIDEPNYLNFEISSSGEKIFLSNAEGKIVDSVLVPQLGYGEVYARNNDGKEPWSIMSESLLESNKTASVSPLKTLSSPLFSHESGFYDEPFTLEIRCKLGQTIYYTLDGSTPTTESNEYKKGIYIDNRSNQPNVVTAVKNVVTEWEDYSPPEEKVDKAVVVRAVVVDKNNCFSEVVTHTYFVGMKKYEQQNVISVVADYEDLFGPEGIFVTGKDYDEKYLEGEVDDLPSANFEKSGRAWEVLGNLQFFSAGEELCNQKAGIRTYGGSNRHAKIKRMSFYARKSYSGSEFFEGLELGGRKVSSMGTTVVLGIFFCHS